jgi:hypothetical protein
MFLWVNVDANAMTRMAEIITTNDCELSAAANCAKYFFDHSYYFFKTFTHTGTKNK